MGIDDADRLTVSTDNSAQWWGAAGSRDYMGVALGAYIIADGVPVCSPGYQGVYRCSPYD